MDWIQRPSMRICVIPSPAVERKSTRTVTEYVATLPPPTDGATFAYSHLVRFRSEYQPSDRRTQELQGIIGPGSSRRMRGRRLLPVGGGNHAMQHARRAAVSRESCHGQWPVGCGYHASRNSIDSTASKNTHLSQLAQVLHPRQ